jgi:SET domain-containing protein
MAKSSAVKKTTVKTKAVKAVTQWEVPTPANNDETMTGAKIGWRQISEDKGRGVFALQNFNKGDILETAPVVIVAKTNIKHNGSAPDGYLLDWDPETKGMEHCMPLGYVMMYNHSKNPNIEIENDMNDFYMTVRAKRAIKKGEELCWNYNCDLWFDAE